MMSSLKRFDPEAGQWVPLVSGRPGEPNALSIGDVITLSPGANATAEITGDSPQQILNLGLPQGPQGNPGDDSTVPGPPNALAIGTVTIGAPGSNAAANITGTPPSQSLNLTIPRGDTGDPTAFELRGTGMPNGIVTAPVGTYYTDTDGTNGAWRWLKKTGTGNTGWDVVHGDTGWRNATRLNGWAGTVRVRRSGHQVNVLLDFLRNGTDTEITVLPSGFLPNSSALNFMVSGGGSTQTVRFLSTGSVTKPLTPSAPSGGAEEVTYATTDPWPTTLPGTPA